MATTWPPFLANSSIHNNYDDLPSCTLTHKHESEIHAPTSVGDGVKQEVEGEQVSNIRAVVSYYLPSYHLHIMATISTLLTNTKVVSLLPSSHFSHLHHHHHCLLLPLPSLPYSQGGSGPPLPPPPCKPSCRHAWHINWYVHCICEVVRRPSIGAKPAGTGFQ